MRIKLERNTGRFYVLEDVDLVVDAVIWSEEPKHPTLRGKRRREQRLSTRVDDVFRRALNIPVDLVVVGGGST